MNKLEELERKVSHVLDVTEEWISQKPIRGFMAATIFNIIGWGFIIWISTP